MTRRATTSDATRRKPAAGTSRRSTAARPSDDQLLDSACAVFAASGFRGASMDAIATMADSTKPTLYAHFGSKEDLHRRCLQREADKLRQSLFATYDRAINLPVEQIVHTDMCAFFDYAAAHPQGFQLLFDHRATSSVNQVREELLEAITGRIANTIRTVMTRRGRPTPATSADTLAAMVVGIAVHGARHALMNSLVDLGQAGELAASLAYAGMRHLDKDLMSTLDNKDHA